MENTSFDTVHKSEIAEVTCIFACRLIDAFKQAGPDQRKKYCLVAQNVSDRDVTQLATRAPSIQHFSKRMKTRLAASLTNMTPFNRDVIQKYIQASTQLERNVQTRSPDELDLPKNTVLHVVKSLYAIPASGLQLYLTYVDNHMRRLGMERTTIDPCVCLGEEKRHQD